MATIIITRALGAGVCLAIACWSILYVPGQLEPWLGTVFAVIAALWLAVESVGVSTWIIFPALWRRPMPGKVAISEQAGSCLPSTPLTTDN